MKKMLLTSIALILILTGCDTSVMDTLNCSYETTTSNMATKVNYMIDYEDTEVKKVRINYDYHYTPIDDTDGDGENDIDGVDTGTDGTTFDTQIDEDGIIDGVIGSAIDTIVSEVYYTILDIANIQERHSIVQDTYSGIQGFSVQTTNDVTDNDYSVSYLIDYDVISDTDLDSLDLSRNIDTLRSNYISQGFTCK